MELKSREDLLSRIYYNTVVPCKDIEISFEVYMSEDAMDPAVFAWARKKMARGMQKELRGLQRFVAQPPRGRKWVAEETAAVSDQSKEVSGDLISTEAAVLEQGALSGCFPSSFTKQIAEAIAAWRYSKPD
ncbi:hypothetical protein POTOM_013024 [Populus tomentosa]|uniref:Uncharacterized protein n=1 Tax=Populus tomentosa TaxID=118781 RepID=A0A8X8D711_POPTO|nr:hypothetical protein POTOM_013024 [Populus tomentosa]